MVQEPVTIEEPLTIAQEPLTIEQEPTTIEQEPITIEQEPTKVYTDRRPPPVITKRKPGRPLGTKNAEPGKPRKPREKKVVFEEPVELVETPYDELPRATPGSLPIPTEAYDLRSAKILHLLQLQTEHRKQQKTRLYSSWFNK